MLHPTGPSDSPIMSVATTARPNTVQLDAEDGGDGWPGGLGPVCVLGSFDVPFGHLAFDEAGVGSLPTGRVQAARELHEDLSRATVSGFRGKNPRL